MTPRSVMPDAARGERRHFAHRIFEAEDFELAHISAQYSDERAITARMGDATSEDHRAAIRCDHRSWVSNHSLHVLFLNRVVNTSTATVLDHP
jgi:hypothetical protein